MPRGRGVDHQRGVEAPDPTAVAAVVAPGLGIDRLGQVVLQRLHRPVGGLVPRVSAHEERPHVVVAHGGEAAAALRVREHEKPGGHIDLQGVDCIRQRSRDRIERLARGRRLAIEADELPAAGVALHAPIDLDQDAGCVPHRVHDLARGCILEGLGRRERLVKSREQREIRRQERVFGGLHRDRRRRARGVLHQGKRGGCEDARERDGEMHGESHRKSFC